MDKVIAAHHSCWSAPCQPTPCMYEAGATGGAVLRYRMLEWCSWQWQPCVAKQTHRCGTAFRLFPLVAVLHRLSCMMCRECHDVPCSPLTVWLSGPHSMLQITGNACEEMQYQGVAASFQNQPQGERHLQLAAVCNDDMAPAPAVPYAWRLYMFCHSIRHC